MLRRGESRGGKARARRHVLHKNEGRRRDLRGVGLRLVSCDPLILLLCYELLPAHHINNGRGIEPLVARSSARRRAIRRKRSSRALQALTIPPALFPSRWPPGQKRL